MALSTVIFCWLAVGFCISYFLLKWKGPRYAEEGLPPGSMGWPIFGQTAEFLREGPNFMKKQRIRYGSFFKTHILGSPTIICMDPVMNRYVLLHEGKGLVPGYPRSLVELLGKRNISAVHGTAHRYIRSSMLSLIGPTVIKERLLIDVDEFMRCHLHNLDGNTIDIQDKTKQMALLISIKLLLGTEFGAFTEALKPEIDKLFLGTISLPIKLLSSNYRRALQARKNIIKLLRQVMEERRASSVMNYDMLDCLLRNEDSKHNLDDEEIIDQAITILHSGQETVSVVLMMAVKYLYDYPRALEKLREEHFAIREMKEASDAIDWNDYKSMSFTRAVIYETMRLATVVNGPMRMTTQKIELNGYVIPKGWRIYVFIGEINYDPIIYPEPYRFNPWRWLEKKSLESHTYSFLFGAGGRQCPGKELALVQVSIFLHYFVTKYRWEVGNGVIHTFPRVKAPNGLPISVSKY